GARRGGCPRRASVGEQAGGFGVGGFFPPPGVGGSGGGRGGRDRGAAAGGLSPSPRCARTSPACGGGVFFRDVFEHLFRQVTAAFVALQHGVEAIGKFGIALRLAADLIE